MTETTAASTRLLTDPAFDAPGLVPTGDRTLAKAI